MLEYTKYIKNAEEPPKQLVIMLHGYGSNKDDLINLAPELSHTLPNALFISPSAPFQLEGNIPFQWEGMAQEGRRQWFSLLDKSDEALLREMKKVEMILLSFILKQLEENKLCEDNLCLLGFSQGTMLSLYLVLERLISPKLLLGYSGLAIDNAWKCGVNKKKTEVMLIYGQEDNIVPIAYMRTTRRILLKCGFQTQTYVSRYLGHGIDVAGIRQGEVFLNDNFLI